ncbi:MAG: dicarboxylate/amino acid:cation symporter [Gemmatimonadaceae bacterium]
MLVALGLALTLGTLLAASGNAVAMKVVDDFRLVGTLWVNAIRMTVIPLVVSLLITGMASVADLGSVGRLGGRTLLVFWALLTGSAIVSLIVAPLLFAMYPWESSGRLALPEGAAAAASEVAASGGAVSIVEWFTTLIPTNPIAAAASGNMMSLIVFTLLLACAAARSSRDAREPLVRFFGSLRDVMLLLVRWIIALAPIAVFALVLPLAARSGASLVGVVGFYIASFAVTCAVVTALFYPVVRILGEVRVGAFARAALPAQLIGISSTSSIATLPAMVESAHALQIPPRVSGFVLPLAVSVFKPAAPVAWIVGVLFIGRFYGVDVGARELGIVAAASIFLSFAAPGVPRGAFLMLTPLFLAIDLPAEGIGVLIAVDAIPDVCATVVNVTGDITATTLVAGPNRAEDRNQGNA